MNHVTFKINHFRRLCIWAARLSLEAEKNYNKRHADVNHVILHRICGGATGEKIPTSFNIFLESADIVIPPEVYVDRFRGFELTRGQLKSCCSVLSPSGYRV
jgi:hypothetical protein